MNRLWVRLSLGFSLLILFGVLIVGLSSVLLNQGRVLQDLITQRFEEPGGLIDILREHYNRVGEWNDVDLILSSQDILIPGGGNDALALVFADAGGTVLYDKYSGLVGQQLTPEQRAQAIIVNTGGRVRGYLLLNSVEIEMRPDGGAFLTQQITNLLLQTLIVVAVISIIGGVVFSRWLTAPLDQLVETVRAFGAHDFDRRAQVTGSAEIAAVASAFNDMASELKSAEMLRRNLTADVAHELRTPLSVLRANLQAILDGVYPMNADEIQRLMDQTELLGHLVNDLHLLAQADAHQMSIHLAPVDLSALVDQTVQQFQPVANEQHVKLMQRLPSQPLITVVDANRIQQVVHNLLQNAITHTPDNGEIAVTVEKSPNEVRIDVRDTGSGIAPEHLAHIFDRFYRIDRSRSRSTGGTGLELAIVKAIVEAHEGSVSAHSEGIPGLGTTFTIRLPNSTQAE